MADERIEIKIVDAIDKGIKNSLLQIANSALEAATSVELLQTELNRLNIGPLAKLAAAHAKVTNATANLTRAQTAMTAANNKAAESGARVNLTLQKQATEAQRTQQQMAKTAAATVASAAASEITANRLLVSNNAAEASTARRAVRQEKENSVVNAAATAQGKLQSSMVRTSEAGKLLASVSASVVRTLAAIVVFGGVRKLLELDSAFSNLQNKLRLVSDTSEQLAANTTRVFEIAGRARAPVEEVATAFQRFDLALRQLGASQEEVFRFTETVTKAVISSGASGEEAANGIRQLTQALNKGKLDGDEFRSVMENIPIVADAIAKELNVTRGELLKLAPQGKITAQILRDAIAGAAEEIEKSFSKTRITVDQAFIVLRNNLLKLKSDFEAATNNSNILARSIKFLADNVHGLALAVSTLLAAGSVPALIKAFTFLRAIAVTSLGALLANPFVALAAAIAAAIPLLFTLSQDSAELAAVLQLMGEAGSAAFALIADSATAVSIVLDAIFGPAIESLQALWREFGGVVTDILIRLANNALLPVRVLVAVFVAGRKSIIEDWQKFPAAFRNIGRLAINGLIELFEKGVNGINKPINSLIDLANKASAKLGGPQLARIATQNLSSFKTVMEKAGTEAGSAFADNFKKELAANDIRNVLDVVTNEARVITEKRKAEAAAQAASKGRGAGEGDPLAQFRDTLEKIKKPINDYKQELTALNALLKAGAISQLEFNAAVNGLTVKDTLQKAREGLPEFEFAEQKAAIDRQLQERLLAQEQFDAIRQQGTLDSLAFIIAAEEEHSRKLSELEAKRAEMALSNASSTFDSLSSIAKDFAGEQSSIYKGLFVASKAFAIAESLVKIQQGIAGALSLPFPANLAAVATVAAQGAAISANLQAVKFADGGAVRGPGGSRSDRIPALLSNGEFVVNAEATRRHRDVLEALNRGNRLRTPGFADGGPVMAPLNPRMTMPFLNRTTGTGPKVTVNVFSVEGVEAKVERKETSNELQFDIILRKVDEDLAAKFSQNRGSLTRVIQQTSRRGF